MTNFSFSEALRPSFMNSWNFIKFATFNDEDAVPVMALGDKSAPAIVFNPTFVSKADVENPDSAMMWMPIALQSLVYNLLIEGIDAIDGIGFYDSADWNAFREKIEEHTTLVWDDLLDLTEERGLEFMTDFIVGSIFVESGLKAEITNRRQAVLEAA